MGGGGKQQGEWTDYGERALYATPKRLTFMEPKESFKDEIQICVIERELWSGGERVEARTLVKRLLMRREII